MFCALLCQDIRRAFTKPLVLWFYYETPAAFNVNFLVFMSDKKNRPYTEKLKFSVFLCFQVHGKM